jgi:hypothetical protein
VAATPNEEGGENVTTAAYRGVPVQPITYRTVAAATRLRFLLADELEARAIGDPERTFVIFMCAYAGDVARRACRPLHRRRRAPLRACLIPAELLERSTLDIARAAAALRVLAAELWAARGEHRADDARGRWGTTSARCGGCLTGSAIPDARRPDAARPDTRADRP